MVFARLKKPTSPETRMPNTSFSASAFAATSASSASLIVGQTFFPLPNWPTIRLSPARIVLSAMACRASPVRRSGLPGPIPITFTFSMNRLLILHKQQLT